MFSGGVKMLKDTKTAASFESDPPYEFSWAREGSIIAECDNWGNIDNSLVLDVYWGVPQTGLLQTNANITWVKDTALTVTIAGSGGTTTNVAGFISIPNMKSRYMKITYTLAGTTKTVDVTTWFYGKN